MEPAANVQVNQMISRERLKKGVKMEAYCMGLLFLAGLTAEDIRKREISVFKVMIFVFMAVIYRLFIKNFLWQDIIWDLFPGGILIFLAFITKESIGYGDGMAVMVLGLWTGGWFTLMSVCAAIMLAGICGAICLFIRKRDPIPFIPFLLLGMEAALAYG